MLGLVSRPSERAEVAEDAVVLKPKAKFSKTVQAMSGVKKARNQAVAAVDGAAVAKAKRRFKPGRRALMEIKRLQKVRSCARRRRVVVVV